MASPTDDEKLGLLSSSKLSVEEMGLDIALPISRWQAVRPSPPLPLNHADP
jgi:hypothetical protein